MRFALMALVAACGGSSKSLPDGAPAVLTLRDLRATTTVSADDMNNLAVATTFDAGSGDMPVPAVQVTATARGMSIPATVTGFNYVETFQGAPVEDESISVAISLGSDTATSTVTMPAAFTIDSVTGTPMTPPITFTWSPTRTDPMHWEFRAGAPSNHQCTGFPPTDNPSFADTGSLTINSAFGAAGGNGCSFSLFFYRTRAGTVAGDAAPGSTITAEQSAYAWPH